MVESIAPYFGIELDDTDGIAEQINISRHRSPICVQRLCSPW